MNFAILPVTVSNTFLSYGYEKVFYQDEAIPKITATCRLSLKFFSSELKSSFKMKFPEGECWLKSLIALYKISSIPDDLLYKDFGLVYCIDVPNPNRVYALQILSPKVQREIYLPMTPCSYGNMAEIKKPFFSLTELESFVAECQQIERPHYIELPEKFVTAWKEKSQN